VARATALAIASRAPASVVATKSLMRDQPVMLARMSEETGHFVRQAQVRRVQRSLYRIFRAARAGLQQIRLIVNAAMLMMFGSVLLLGSTPASAAAPGPQHVMSLSMCTDDLLLELLPPERIASVTYYSRDPGNSYQWPLAAKVRVNSGTVEEVLAEKPDLVLAGTYTTPAARSLLKKLASAIARSSACSGFR